ncbi:MAG: hypothetical protein D6717_06365, partial [Gammaproteobacteria bacterium]
MSMQEAFGQLFGDVLVSLWFALTLAAAGVGLWALVAPGSFVRFNQRASRWLSADGVVPPPVRKAPERRVFIERLFYRHHMLTGAALMLGSLYCLYAVLFVLDPQAVKAALAQGDALRQMLVDAAFGFVYLASIAVLFIGFTVFVRPSLLKRLEGWGNRWVETDQWLKNADKRNEKLDQWAIRHPRAFAIIVLILGGLSAWMIWRY